MAVIAPDSPYSVCYGSSTVNIDGATPAVLSGVNAGNPHWLLNNGTKLIYQNVTAGTILQTLTLPATLATASASGQNGLGAGANVWAAFLAGVRTSTPPNLTLAQAGLYDVSELGQIAVCDDRATASGLTVYTAAGATQYHVDTVILNPTVHVRSNLLSYQDADGWHLIDLTTLGPVPRFQPRANVTNLIPFRLGTTPCVFEYDAATVTLSVRQASQLQGLVIDTGGTLFYGIDVLGTGTASCRFVWCSGASEARTELIILDINTSTGATERGTVVGTSMTFVTGPTLEGHTFQGSTAGLLPLPVHSQLAIDLKTGLMTKPWRDALQQTNRLVQGVQTRQNNTPVVIQTPSFGVITDDSGTDVSAVTPGDDVTFASADGSVTITANPATKTIDFAAATTTGGDVALHRLCGGM